MPTADEVEYREKYERCLITTKKAYPGKEFLLQVKGVNTLSTGDLHMVQAQVKQGKTTLITIMVAAILSGHWGCVKRAIQRDVKILIFDTEQFETDTFRQYQNMLSMGGLQEEDLGRLQVYNLRDMSYQERRDFIVKTMERENATLAVLDGIRDLTPDINDSVACPQLVNEMMRLASKLRCAILGVLHNNPNEGKARGWIGTEWINKCGYSFEPQKSGNVVTVKNVVFRGAMAPEWQFTFDKDGTPTCDDDELQVAAAVYQQTLAREAEQQRQLKHKEDVEKVTELLREECAGMSRAEFVTAIVEKGMMSRTAAYNLIKEQLALPQPPFREVSGKMMLTEQPVQQELEF